VILSTSYTNALYRLTIMADNSAQVQAILNFLSSPKTLAVVNFLTFISLLLTLAIRLSLREPLPEQDCCSCKQYLDNYGQLNKSLLDVLDERFRHQQRIEELLARSQRELLEAQELLEEQRQQLETRERETDQQRSDYY